MEVPRNFVSVVLILWTNLVVINVHEESIQALKFVRLHERKGIDPRNNNQQQ